MIEFIADNLPNRYEVLTIFLMGAVTYLTRIAGWLLLSRMTLSKRTLAVLKASPCCVMASIAAPSFMTCDPAVLVSLMVAIVVALRFNFAVTVVVSAACCTFLQQIL